MACGKSCARPRTNRDGVDNVRRQNLATITAGLLCSALLLVSSGALADARTEAKSHFKKGMGLISDGKYEEGISELQRAYEILPHPNVLYNIARAYAESGDLEGAVASYKKYLEGNPQDRDEVSQIVANIEARLRRQQAVAAAASQVQVTPAVTPGTTPGTTTPGTTPGVTPGTTTPGPTTTIVETPGAQAAGPKVDVGQAKTEDVFEETVVTASKGAQSPLDAPNSTSIITEQDIRLSGIIEIPELLRRLAGVDIMEPTAGQPEVSLRGFNQRLSNKVLVLINGRSVYVDLLGNTFWATLSIGVEDIERIEVVGGPGSALYGADALNGVINIITKAPGEGKSGVNAGIGSQGQTHGSVWASGRDRELAWRASAGYDYVPVWSREVNDTRQDLTLISPYQNTATKTTRMDLRLTRQIGSEVTAGVGGGFSRGTTDFEAYGPLNYLRFNELQTSDITAFVNSKHLELRVFWNDTRTNDFGLNAAQIGQSLLRGNASIDVVDGELQYLNQFATGPLNHDLHIGLGYRYKQVHWSYQDRDRYEHHESAYLHDEIKIGEKFALVGDFRGDYVPFLAQIKPSARGSLIFHPSKQSAFRGTVATAFRTPTFLESYLKIPVQLPVAGVSLLSEGQPADLPGFKLQAEQIFTAEIGYLNQESDLFTFDSAFFYNHLTSLSQLAVNRPVTVGGLANGLGGFDSQNGTFPVVYGGFENQCQAYNVFGAELGVRAFPTEGLDLYANYTAMNVSTDKSACTEEQKAATVDDQRTSAHKINAGVQVRTKAGIDGSVDFHFVSSQAWAEQVTNIQLQRIEYHLFPLDAYTLLNARIGYRFLKNQAEVSATAFNLLGIEHREHPFGQLVGRRAMGFFTYRF
jgi:outer membrane receptor for ferrienterochelin and colicin